MAQKKATKDFGLERTHTRSHAMAQAVVSAFTSLLKEEAHKHGGFLGLRHLDEMEAVFQAKVGELSEVFEQALQDSHREQEDLKWNAIKRPAFDRLMVKHFENLFFSYEDNGNTHGIISRRILPGFFLALNMMLGPEAMKSYQKRCDNARDRVMGGKLPVNWDLVERDGAVRAAILDAQYTIARYFEDPFQRADWFINIINTNLAPTQDAARDTHWQLDRRSLFKLISFLLLDLKKAVIDDVAWTRLAIRHDGADRKKLHAILKKL